MVKVESQMIFITSSKMAVNETDFVEAVFGQEDENISNQTCIPIPRSECIGHPYHCYCQEEKVGNGHIYFWFDSYCFTLYA